FVPSALMVPIKGRWLRRVQVGPCEGSGAAGGEASGAARMFIAANAATASAIRSACHAREQSRWSHVREFWWGLVMPYASSGSLALSGPAHVRHRPGGEDVGLRQSHSAMQQACALASALARGRRPSCSAMPALSSQKTLQSSAVQGSGSDCPGPGGGTLV